MKVFEWEGKTNFLHPFHFGFSLVFSWKQAREQDVKGLLCCNDHVNMKCENVKHEGFLRTS